MELLDEFCFLPIDMFSSEYGYAVLVTVDDGTRVWAPAGFLRLLQNLNGSRCVLREVAADELACAPADVVGEKAIVVDLSGVPQADDLVVVAGLMAATEFASSAVIALCPDVRCHRSGEIITGSRQSRPEIRRLMSRWAYRSELTSAEYFGECRRVYESISVDLNLIVTRSASNRSSLVSVLDSVLRTSAFWGYQMIPPIPQARPYEVKHLRRLKECGPRVLMTAADEIARSAQYAFLCNDLDFLSSVGVGASDLPDTWMRALKYEEMRCTMSALVDHKSPFIFESRFLGGVLPEEEAEARLDKHLGGYLAALDLTRSVLTGSAVHSALVPSSREAAFASYEDYADTWMPATVTKPASSYDAETFASMISGGFLSEARFDGNRCFLGGESCAFELAPGSDIDMAIAVDTWEEFDSVARGHFDALISKGLQCELVRRQRGANTYTWDIVFGSLRTIEMYRVESPWTWTAHHLAYARAAYTSYGSDRPRFLMTASFLDAAVDPAFAEDFRFFVGKKASPVEIIIKYLWKLGDKRVPGFLLLPGVAADPFVSRFLSEYLDDPDFPYASTRGFRLPFASQTAKQTLEFCSE